MKRNALLMALAALSAIGLGGAYAARTVDNDARTVETAKISLAQAAIAAEQHGGGRACRAELETSHGLSVFEVEVVNGKSVRDVKVDATTGKVLAAVEDEVDRDDDQDQAD